MEISNLSGKELKEIVIKAYQTGEKNGGIE